MAHAPFIGMEAVTTIATSIAPEIAMSVYYDRQTTFDKFGINVIHGAGFRNIKHVLWRKGHTTRRKKMGDTILSTAGKMLERELITYLAWNRYKSNIDDFREYAITDAEGNVTYPESTEVMREVLANYNEDLFDCLWHGNHVLDSDADYSYLGLYDGFLTDLANDVAKGYVTPITLSGTIQRPVDNTDAQAYLLFVEFHDKWHPHLKSAKRVIVGMNTETAEAISDAYGNYKNNNKEVITLPNGNYKFPHWNNVEIAFDDSLGKGTKMIAYTENNLEYGIDTENDENTVYVQVGTGDNDAKDIFFQPETAQGTRIVRVDESHFACTSDALSPVSLSGDYTAAHFYIGVNDDEMGSVLVNGEPYDKNAEYDYGTNLVLKAVPAAGHKLVKWGNDATDAQITVVTTGKPETMAVTFAAE